MASPASPTRVLYVAAAPDRDISTEKEFKRVREILDGIPGLEFHSVFCANIVDLQNELIKRDFDVVHLAAHGDRAGPELEDEGGPFGGNVPASVIIELLRQHSSLRCVVLNACFSASWFAQPLGPDLIVMRGPISDAAALEFSEGFYRSFVAGRPTPTSFEHGKTRVGLTLKGVEFDPVHIPHCRGVLGIRDRQRLAPDAHRRSQYFCGLEAFIDRPDPDWDGAVRRLREFVADADLQAELATGEHVLYLDCDGGIALQAGRLLGAHSRVYALQGRPARELWKPDPHLPVPSEPQWTIEPVSIGSQKLVVSISLANDTRPLVEKHLQESGVSARWFDLRPSGGANTTAVRSADHANALARTLAAELGRLRTQFGFEEIDLYFSAPNGFMYLLGQQGVGLGTLNLYHKPHGELRYVPSFRSTSVTLA